MYEFDAGRIKRCHLPLRCKINQADATGRPSTYQCSAPRKIAMVGSLQPTAIGVFIVGLVDGVPRSMLVDTGAIIRPNIVSKSAKIQPSRWRLRTASGSPAAIQGEVSFVIGVTIFTHRTLTVNIEEELTLGMDIINARGFELNFPCGTMKINDEVVLHEGKEQRICVLLEDVSVPERCELILPGYLESRAGDDTIMMFEPRFHDCNMALGIEAGKRLLRAQQLVPRVMNLNYHSVPMKKGILLGYCGSISAIIHETGSAKEVTMTFSNRGSWGKVEYRGKMK